jgi:hypothetical protein
LIREVRPSAVDWWIGTLLFACGGILMAVQQAKFEAIIVPLAFGMVFVGATLYWRSIRSFCALRSGAWMFAPAMLGIFGIVMFSALDQDHTIRGAIASTVLAMVLGARCSAAHVQACCSAAASSSGCATAWAQSRCDR